MSETDAVYRCQCGVFRARCCPDCVRGRCEECGERWDWRAVDRQRAPADAAQATLGAVAADGGERA